MLEFREELLDGIEVWAVRRQEEEVSSPFSDGLAGCLTFMRAEIVEYHDIARLESWSQYLFDIGGEEFAVDWAVDDAGGVDPVMPESRDEGERLPVAIRNLGVETLASRRPTTQRRHVGLYPGLVNKDKPAGSDPSLMGLPALAFPGDVRPILLGRQNSFF